MAKQETEIATFGGGCYWCLEAIFQRIYGVQSVVSGYSGGHLAHPTTLQVYDGGSGHAEVVQVIYNPDAVSYRELLEIFFTMHDPTTLNRQGNDVGEIYRSIILYHSEEQRQVAEDMILGFAATAWDNAVVTELVPFDTFWPADESQQDFYSTNPSAGYCVVIISPKIQKLRKQFAAKLKPV